MIKNIEHAIEVQKRRFKNEKYGISKAIRRWFNHQDIINEGISHYRDSIFYKKLRYFANFDNCKDYRPARKIVLKNTLEWVEPKDSFYYMSHEGKRRGK